MKYAKIVFVVVLASAMVKGKGKRKGEESNQVTPVRGPNTQKLALMTTAIIKSLKGRIHNGSHPMV